MEFWLVQNARELAVVPMKNANLEGCGIDDEDIGLGPRGKKRIGQLTGIELIAARKSPSSFHRQRGPLLRLRWPNRLEGSVLPSQDSNAACQSVEDHELCQAIPVDIQTAGSIRRGITQAFTVVSAAAISPSDELQLVIQF